MHHLTATTVSTLDDRGAVPTYDRSQLRTGMVNFGVGGFHREHQAMYVDTLMNAGTAFE